MGAGWPPKMELGTPTTPYSHMITRFYTIEQVPPYLGIHSEDPTLHVHAQLGPAILANLSVSGVNVELRERNMFQQWALRNKSLSPHAYAECVNLAHGIHLQILEEKSAPAALRSSLRFEMGLRMLHALLEVERAVCCEAITRSQAKSSNRHLLEHQPDSGIGDDAGTRMLQQDYLQHAKFEASVRRKTNADSDTDSPKKK